MWRSGETGLLAIVLAVLLASCIAPGGGDSSGESEGDAAASDTGSNGNGGGDDGSETSSDSGSNFDGSVDRKSWPQAGNPSRPCNDVPEEAKPVDTSNPDTVVGEGTPESCTGKAFVDAVAKGGVITFDCGPEPVVIELEQTAKIYNDAKRRVVIDGGGKVALSGQGERRILYMNTCDKDLNFTTSHCQNQDHPQLTLQNLTFIRGNARNADKKTGAGGAVFVRGGRLKVVDCRFFDNVCAKTGPDVGGASIRALSQYQDKPIYVVDSTFGGKPELGNACSNGAGLSSIGVSWTVVNSLFSHNDAIGRGANPPQKGTPGGGSGGGIYNDGNTYTLRLCGTKMVNNHANEGGGAIFFVSNDETGELVIEDSTLRENPSDEFETIPGIFYKGKSEEPRVENSTVE